MAAAVAKRPGLARRIEAAEQRFYAPRPCAGFKTGGP
jgi:hypothetical protein